MSILIMFEINSVVLGMALETAVRPAYPYLAFAGCPDEHEDRLYIILVVTVRAGIKRPTRCQLHSYARPFVLLAVFMVVRFFCCSGAKDGHLSLVADERRGK